MNWTFREKELEVRISLTFQALQQMREITIQEEPIHYNLTI